MGTALSASTLGDLKATRKRQSYHQLTTVKWNITSPTVNVLVEDAKRHSLDVVDISSTKGRGSNTV